MKSFVLTTVFITNLFGKVIVFDWHGVIANFSKTNALSSFYKMDNKLNFFKNLYKFTKRGIIEKQTEWRSITNALNKNQQDDVYALINCHKLNNQMIDIIYDLHKKKYPLALFSNVDKDSLDWFSQNNKQVKRLLEIFQLIWTPCLENGYVRKSDPKAYQDFLEKFKEKFGDQDLIFIDDSKSKIKLAQKTGIKTYYFRSAAKFKNDLDDILS
jgi:FMN phosphatase YigB (HAD superfamily)